MRCLPAERFFIPKNGKKRRSGEVLLTMDEIEAIRLADLEGLSQDETARRMKVHRSTISRILGSAHRKLADALVHIRSIKVEEGCCKFVKRKKLDPEVLMNRTKVLFVCIHNSARSQMAEAYLKKIGGPEFEVESAGLEPGTLNPLVVQVMQDDGIDISQNKTKSAFDLYKQGRHYNYVITVCDESQAERCPLYPGVMQKIHWSFRDPSSFSGTTDEKLVRTREVRNEIKSAVQKWAASLKQSQKEK